MRACRDGLVVNVSARHVVGHGFAPRLGHTKVYHKNVQTAFMVGT